MASWARPRKDFVRKPRVQNLGHFQNKWFPLYYRTRTHFSPSWTQSTVQYSRRRTVVFFFWFSLGLTDTRRSPGFLFIPGQYCPFVELENYWQSTVLHKRVGNLLPIICQCRRFQKKNVGKKKRGYGIHFWFSLENCIIVHGVKEESIRVLLLHSSFFHINVSINYYNY